MTENEFQEKIEKLKIYIDAMVQFSDNNINSLTFHDEEHLHFQEFSIWMFQVLSNHLLTTRDLLFIKKPLGHLLTFSLICRACLEVVAQINWVCEDDRENKSKLFFEYIDAKNKFYQIKNKLISITPELEQEIKKFIVEEKRDRSLCRVSEEDFFINWFRVYDQKLSMGKLIRKVDKHFKKQYGLKGLNEAAYKVTSGLAHSDPHALSKIVVRDEEALFLNCADLELIQECLSHILVYYQMGLTVLLKVFNLENLLAECESIFKKLMEDKSNIK